MNALQNIKKIGLTLLIVSIFFRTHYGYAHNEYPPRFYFCDLCGCTTSGGSFGFGDLTASNFIGIRYTYQKYHSRNGIFANSPKSIETINTVQLWARVPLSKKLSVSTIIPVNYLQRTFEGSDENIQGLGDINIMGWYSIPLFKNTVKDSISVRDIPLSATHTLSFGLGLKLPTGSFEETLTDRVNPGFQVGTGSVDYIAALSYNFGKNNFGFNASTTYYLKTSNKNDYRFGNQFSYAVNGFYNLLRTNTFLLRPFIGISGDFFDSIEQYNQKQPDTNGSILHGAIGTEIGFDKFITGFTYSNPIQQDLFGGNVDAKSRFSAYLNFNF
ncbi:hypothetical protein MWU59_06550 [Flavobacteriaceae bacterium F08102]|nr:hypothetical protein [Flavobacteriaceae bacterium F08102]